MAVPKETQWAIDEHTKAKHAILEAYLSAWFPILTSRNSRVVYVDGFCGPGSYSNGDRGSPIIALDLAAQHRKQLTGHVVFLFIDERGDRIEHLQTELARLKVPENFDVYPEVGKCDAIMSATLDDLDAKGQKLAPTFVFLDPFGFSGIPFDLVARILDNPQSEVFITFMINAVLRFLTHPDSNVVGHIESLFGTSVAGITDAEDRGAAARELYKSQLQSRARFVRSFGIRDTPGRALYDLFFASNHPLGHQKMKEAMWKVDPQGSFRFVDHTDPDQLLLLTDDPASKLADSLLRQFQNRTVTASEVLGYVMDQTGFIDKHTRAALRVLEVKGDVVVAQRKTDGKRRRKNSYTPECVLTFRGLRK